MNERTMGIMSGIAQGIEKFSTNLYNIGIAERKLKREQEIFNLDKKIKGAELNKMEALYGEDAIAHEKKMWKLEETKTKAATEQALANIAQTKTENTQKLQEAKTAGMAGWAFGVPGFGAPEAEDVKDFLPQNEEINRPEGFGVGVIEPGEWSKMRVPLARGKVKAGFEEAGYRPEFGEESTYYEQYDTDVRSAEAGKISWEDLEQKYPRRRKEIGEFRGQAKLAEPLEKSPRFRQGKGLSAFVSKDIANLNEKTLKVAEQIETLGDLAELVERADEAKSKGIDIDGILEYFGKSREEIEALSE